MCDTPQIMAALKCLAVAREQVWKDRFGTPDLARQSISKTLPLAALR
jgi:hypothetical protein